METPWTAVGSGSISPMTLWDEVQSLPSSSAVNRTFVIREGRTECSIKIHSHGIWSQCIQLGREFQNSLENRLRNISDCVDTTSSRLELFSGFIRFILDTIANKPSEENSNISVLKEILSAFQDQFLKGENIHTIVASHVDSKSNQKSIIHTYLQACLLTNSPYSSDRTGLFFDAKNGKAKLVALFNGQGVDSYFEELVERYETYHDIVVDYVSTLSRYLVKLSQSADVKEHYPNGLNVHQWLKNPETRPSTKYLISAPVSLPLIGLSQLLCYASVCLNLGISPGEFRKHLSGAVGHSQGIIVAAFVASADSWESFNTISEDVMRILLCMGCYSQQHVPVPSSLEDGKATSCMLSVKGMTQAKLQEHIDGLNMYLSDSRKTHIALVNGPGQFVVAGSPISVEGLRKKLANLQKPEKNAKIPFSQRTQSPSIRLLPITVPYHSPYLKAVEARLLKDLSFVTLTGQDLVIPVYHTVNAQNLQHEDNLLPQFVRMICTGRVNWDMVSAKAFEGITHLVDFGPGGDIGIGIITREQRDGTGLQTVVLGANTGSNTSLDYAATFYACQRPIRYRPIWSAEFSPSLLKTSEGLRVDTKLSRLLGVPPVMVAGMTPTTTAWDFVAAIMNAGFHAELACGGFHNADAMRKGISSLASAITPGCGITCNLIYANPRAMSWQISVLKEMRQAGIPITGLTIGAGIPSPDVISGYITDLGLLHLGLKPGSKDSIDAVLGIAQIHPNFPIILQWTGGRGGGHHSYEDFHEPILSRYGRIRAQENIILVAGSGFGEAEDTYPYLTGSWSCKHDRPPMPFDGILLGSRVMTAKEAHTSSAAKLAIVRSPGVPDKLWEGTYKEPTGGIITVRSEMGEPIHKLATRGVMLWAELDREVFSLPKEKQAEKLLRKKEHYIQRLNKDFQKVWFGSKRGSHCDLRDMTYLEILERMANLLYLREENRWIDPSYQKLTFAYLQRAEQRLCDLKNGKSPHFKDISQLDIPDGYLKKFSTQYPQAEDLIITASDADFFVLLCRQPGQKPVPFILLFDEEFEYWFKKDSLWQSECIEAVPDQDVERTCILHGPVAAQYTKIIDEPVKQILGRIHQSHSEWVLRDRYNGKVEQIGAYDSDNADGPSQLHVEGVAIDVESGGAVRCSLTKGSKPPSLDKWLALISGPASTWRHVVLNTPFIVQNQRVVKNPIRSLFAPESGLTVEISNPQSHTNMEIMLKERNDADDLITTAHLKNNLNELVQLSLSFRTSNGNSEALEFHFEYKSGDILPLREVTKNREAEIGRFYQGVWIGGQEGSFEFLKAVVFRGGPITLHRHDIVEFSKAIRNQNPSYRNGQKVLAPLDMAISIVWKPVMSCVFSQYVSGDLLKLLHLSNGFQVCAGAKALTEGDHLHAEGRLKAVKIKKGTGKIVRVEGTIFRDCSAVVRLTSEFILLGEYTDYSSTFEEIEESLCIRMDSIKDVVLLKSRNWFFTHDNIDLKDCLGKTLKFDISSRSCFGDDESLSSISVKGLVIHESQSGERVNIGFVNFSGESYAKNPVTEYLQRHGAKSRDSELFNVPRPLLQDLIIDVPDNSREYAQASADFNPIHLSCLFARYAGHEGRVTHGMLSSGMIRSVVEHHIAQDDPSRMKSWNCSFDGKVSPGDSLSIAVSHVGMSEGRMLLTVEARQVRTKLKVFSAQSELEQPPTAYVFTGQGSQQQNMGMELYSHSPSARQVWQAADDYFMETFGFSIVDIVRSNPKELIVYFGGTKGRSIRENYMTMTFDAIDEKGVIVPQPMFPGINSKTRSYTFKSANGLLHETQFTQPALVLMELARFADMKSKGIIKRESLFAGHSLGEYVALAAIGELFSVEKVAELVFYRGLTMQNTVEVKADGTTEYSMCAINPSRISTEFGEKDLRWCVAEIAKQTGGLLEIVNYNISNMQYVCAGNLRSLATLTSLTDHMASNPTQITDRCHLENQVGVFLDRLDKCKGPIALQRGKAAVPLRVNVPFHSSLLKPRVESFRRFLEQTISPSMVRQERLVGKYIPNLNAKPFELSREYIESVHRLTSSPVLGEILRNAEKNAEDINSICEATEGACG